MKKAKSVMSVLAIVFACLTALSIVAVPLIDMLAGMLTKGAPKADFGAAMSALGGRFGQLIPNISSFFSSFDIAGNLTLAIILIASVIVFGLFVVAVVMVCVKKQAKALGLLIPAFVLYLVAAVATEIALVPYSVYSTGSGDGVYVLTVAESGFALYAVYAFAVLTVVSAILAMVFAIVFAAKCKVEKAAKVEEAAVVEEEAVPETVEEKIVPVAAAVAPEAVAVEKAPEPVVEEKVEPAKEEEPAKIVRRILVHRSGKVVRVLNEYYYDVTTNIYVEPGYVDASLPVETEQQHYEKILNVSKQEAPAPAPAPVAPAPAPAPVAPAPAPVEKVKIERIPFAVRLKEADKGLKAAYNVIKSEILSYGIKSRISSSGDTFRLHTKTYVKVVIAGKSLKLYFALDPKAYKDSTFPIGDASKKVAHVETPLVFKVKSDLSVRRAKQLIAACAAKDGLVQGEVVAYNHAKEVK